MDRFKHKAKTWDNNPIRLQMAHKFFSEIIKSVDIKKDFSILDFGCGTGLLGLQFQDKVNHITMIDTSKEMLEVLEEKVTKNNFNNISILNAKIEKTNIDKAKFNLIVSLMAFHHVANIEEVIKTFKKLLKPGGYIIIGDLVKEDGSFHNYEHVEHRGFELDFIEGIFKSNGFSIKRLDIFNVVKKPDKNAKHNSFEQFCLIAQKK